MNSFINFLKKYKNISVTLLCVTGMFLSFILIDFIYPVDTHINYSQIITDKDNKVIHAFLSSDDKWRMKTELHEIIPSLKASIINKEDKYFYSHPGFNIIAISRAAFNNFIYRKKTSGASTITMQVARMLAPKERNIGNKLLEIFRAMQLEWHYSKDEILQLYINLVPYGGNIEGVKSASILYFGITPNRLSLAQVITLTIIPNRPTSLLLGKNNELVLKERNKWIRRFEEDETFPSYDLSAAYTEPLNAKRLKAPKEAPHFSNRMRKKYPEMSIIHTSISSATQEKTRQLCYNYSKRIKNIHIHNAAVLILNNKTHAVEAYIGSPDFNDSEHSGQVDGITAIRSPGSTLKPLIYALGFDAGIITPKTIITDVPTDFEGYAPENFDKKFNGKVSIETALSYSLNIPAVKTLQQVGVPVFVQALKKANFRKIAKDEHKLGLSSILGGCGVSLEELCTLFAAFANDGKYTGIKYLPEKPLGKSTQIISPAANYMITDILTQITRPDLPHNAESSYRIPTVAWKTGTSYGRRDAWSIGYNKNYTIGVWIGNFNGEGVHELTGADIATPLLFELFNTLDYNSSNNWFQKPKELQYRFVCPESGLLPGEYCSNTILDCYIPKISPINICEHVKMVYVSADESYSYCMSCLPEGGYKKKLYTNLAPELIDYYKDEHIAFTVIPEHNPWCNRVFHDHGPGIVSPANNKEYILEKDDPAEIMLKCTAHNEVKKVYWYINDRFFKEATPNERVFFKPEEGKIKISCSDDKGRNSNCFIIARYQ